MRRLGFDRDEVVEKAMHLFWLKGYNATTVDDLLAAMGIRRSSFYNTFGGKKPLFREALDKYRESVPSSLLGKVGPEDSVRQALRDLFDACVEIGATDPQARGCLQVNSIVELSASHPELGPQVAGDLTQARNIIARLIKQAQTRGEISANQDAEALASYLTSALAGIRVLAKAIPDRKVLRAAADVTLSALDR